MLVVAALIALAAAGVWTAILGDGFRVKLAFTLLAIAAIVGLTGGNALARASTDRERAFLGRGPDREDPDPGPGLTGMGVALFVSLPLFLAGGILYGSG